MLIQNKNDTQKVINTTKMKQNIQGDAYCYEMNV